MASCDINPSLPFDIFKDKAANEHQINGDIGIQGLNKPIFTNTRLLPGPRLSQRQIDNTLERGKRKSIPIATQTPDEFPERQPNPYRAVKLKKEGISRYELKKKSEKSIGMVKRSVPSKLKLGLEHSTDTKSSLA